MIDNELLHEEYLNWSLTTTVTRLRFGQYWINKYGPHPCPEVFYEEDWQVAYNKIEMLINDNTYKR